MNCGCLRVLVKTVDTLLLLLTHRVLKDLKIVRNLLDSLAAINVGLEHIIVHLSDPPEERREKADITARRAGVQLHCGLGPRLVPYSRMRPTGLGKKCEAGKRLSRMTGDWPIAQKPTATVGDNQARVLPILRKVRSTTK